MIQYVLDDIFIDILLDKQKYLQNCWSKYMSDDIKPLEYIKHTELKFYKKK